LVNEGDVLISDARDLDPQEGINLRASRLALLPKMDDLLNPKRTLTNLLSLIAEMFN